jgi:hypothetical protein
VIALLGRQLEPEHLVEEVGIAELALGRLFQQGAEVGVHAVQPEPLAGLAQPVELRGRMRRAHAAAPSTRAA